MSTEAQARKDKLISDLIQARRSILEAAACLPPDRRDEAFLGTWSVKDLLAHLIGWDFVNIESVQAVLADQMPAFAAHYDPDWRTYNARLVAEYRKDDWDELLSSIAASHQKLIGVLETTPAQEFDRDRGLRFKDYPVIISDILHAEVKDEREHGRQIEEFAGR